MTKDQVRKAFQRGLGRGILAVQENPDRYRELVLWACGRNLSFDTQCEGTRAWYDYQLIQCYPDNKEFLELIEQKLRSKKPDSGWDYLHFSELLMYFAMDGNENAAAALWDKYEELFSSLNSFRRSSLIKRRTVECFETLCIALSWDKENYFRIAEDIGGLFLSSNQYDAWDFAWLYDSRPRWFNSELKRKSKFSRELSAFFSAFDDLKKEQKNWSANRSENRIPEGGRALSVYLKWKAPELTASYVEIYLSKKNPQERAKALEAFSVCPYPMDPTPILKDAESDCHSLRSAAIEALGEIRNQKVREYAWKHIEDDIDGMLPIVIKNYMPEDEAFLRKYISELQVDYSCKSGWHGVHMDIRDLFDEDAGITKPPKSLLPILYESTLCSFCREAVVRLMSKYRMISDSMWEELLFDSNDDIRAFADAHFRRSMLPAKNKNS